MAYFYKSHIALKCSQIAIWSHRVSFFALAIAFLGIYLARSGKVEPVQAIAVIGAAFFLGVVAIILAIFSFVIIWQTGVSGLKSAYLGLVISIGLLAYPAYFAIIAFTLPVLSDITSDFNDPPHQLGSKSLPAYNTDNAVAQRKSYPDIQPIILDLNLQDSLNLVLDAMRSMKLSQINTSTQNTGLEAQIESVEYSFVLKSPDDIIIRLRSSGQETRVDMRSTTRFAALGLGRHDFGANAARLSKLIENIVDASKQR
jgi:uncharacterized protein (DUF1499 family)